MKGEATLACVGAKYLECSYILYRCEKQAVLDFFYVP